MCPRLSITRKVWSPLLFCGRFCNAPVGKQRHVLQKSFQTGRVLCASGFWVGAYKKSCAVSTVEQKHGHDEVFLGDTLSQPETTVRHLNIYLTARHRVGMPFLGQDWRSPGQSWVKTEEGWKKTTTDEKNNNDSVERFVIKHVPRNVAVSITAAFEYRNSNCAITLSKRVRGRGRFEERPDSIMNKGRDTH